MGSDEDIANELAKDGADDDEESYTVSGDDGWYIADTFGTADSRFGKSLTKEKPTLSTYLKDLSTAQSWVAKYGSKPLLYEKDLKVAYNAVTQLGAEFTGGEVRELVEEQEKEESQ